MKNKIISFIMCFSFIVCAFLSCIDFWCFNNSFYKNEYSKLNTASDIGMSSEDLNNTTDVLLGYLKGKYETLEVSANVNGKDRLVFNERETAHMVDVKDLYDNALLVRNILFVVYLVFFVYILYTNQASLIFYEYKKALLVIGFIIGFILLFCLIDFDGFWLNFHHVFFPNNDLWLLDPRTDILIMMVPEQFFFDLCISIIVSIIAFLTLIYFVLKLLDKRTYA